MTATSLVIEFDVHFGLQARGRKELHPGPKLAAAAVQRVPRVSRLMALAIRFERLVSTGQVANYAELARLGHVTRARVCQIMNLVQLAPDVQEELLFLPPVTRGRDPIRLWQMLPIATALDWRKQRVLWKRLKDIAFDNGR
jgi:hypothetical protein